MDRKKMLKSDQFFLIFLDSLFCFLVNFQILFASCAALSNLAGFKALIWFSKVSFRMCSRLNIFMSWFSACLQEMRGLPQFLFPSRASEKATCLTSLLSSITSIFCKKSSLFSVSEFQHWANVCHVVVRCPSNQYNWWNLPIFFHK